jgi:DNA-directed RNA polymerase specialized sigma24 family protein
VPDIQPKKDLTPESFARFLAWLDPDRDRAGEAYEKLRFSLSTYFARRRCVYADELVDETINRVIVKIDEPIENKMGYCYGVARNIYLESLRKERFLVDIDEVSVAAAPPPEAEDFSHECLDKCLATLPPNKREVLLQYFSEDKSRKIRMRQLISTSLKKTQTALRMEILRMKQKLTICVKQCMNE